MNIRKITGIILATGLIALSTCSFAQDAATEEITETQIVEEIIVEEVAPAEVGEVEPASVETLMPAITVDTNPFPTDIVDIAEKVQDTNLFRRTPQIDGVINAGEWDVFETGAGYDLYADWDTNNIYFAAKSTKPLHLSASIDARGDGWYHGDDNYAFFFNQLEDGEHGINVRFYKSTDAHEPAAVVVSPQVAAFVDSSSSFANGFYMLEVRVPRAIFPGITFKENNKIGLQVANYSFSSDIIEKTVDCTLVTKKFASIDNLVLGFDVMNNKIARGDELIAKFHMRNDSNEPLDIRNVVIAGEGLSENYLSSKKVRFEDLASGKHVSQEITSIIPKDMPLGSWALGAEVTSGARRLGGAILSFEIVEPFEFSLSLPTKEVRADVKDVTIKVQINSNCSSRLYGDVELTMPTGWEVQKSNARKFSIPSKYSLATVLFKVKPPLGVIGTVPVSVSVMANDMTRYAEGSFTVIAPE